MRGLLGDLPFLWSHHRNTLFPHVPRNVTRSWSRSPSSHRLYPVSPIANDSSPVVEYEPIEGVERLYYYRPGGYHPVSIGDKLHGKYRVMHKLGHGSYSTTWLARDEYLRRYVAVKVAVADSHHREIDIISTLARRRERAPAGSNTPEDVPIPPLFDSFDVQGPNGTHPCHVTAPARSSITGALEASYVRLFQLDVARALAAQLVAAVAYIHSRGYVHGDLHLGNILLRLPRSLDRLSEEQLYDTYGRPNVEPVVRLDGAKELLPRGVPSHAVTPVRLGDRCQDVSLREAEIMLADFGEAFAPAEDARFESHAPLSVRAPEARFEPGAPLSFASDIWSLACSVWAVLGQRPLFDDFLATDDDTTCEHVDVLGPLPPGWWREWEGRGDWFTDAGEPVVERGRLSLEDRFELGVQAPRRRKDMEPLDPAEARAILAMLRSMLAFEPEDRPTADQVLMYEWIQRWAMPEYEKIRRKNGPGSE